MKKLTSLISLLVLSFFGLAQNQPPIVNRQPSVSNTLMDHHLFVDFAFRTPVFADTTAANAIVSLDSCGKMIFTYDVNGHWARVCNPKRWVRVGGVTNIQSSNSILVSGDGGDTAYVPTLIASQQSGNAVQILPDGVFVQAQIPNGLIEGGRVIQRTGLTYTIQAARYAINGVIYTSPETDVTLDAANSDPRFDAFIVTTNSTADKITGTPDPTNPQNPSFDPLTQLPLTFVQVGANITEPAFCRDSIYYPNNGNTWTALSSNAGRINLTSTTDPYSVTQAIDFTLAQNNDFARFEKGSVISVSTYSVMVLRMKSKALWASTSRISIRFYNDATPLGIAVIVGDNTPYGFNSSNTAQYQTPIIPLENFGNVTGANAIVITVVNTGANTIGFRLDDFELLGCDGAPVPTTGSFWETVGNQEGRILYGGTLDNFPVQFKVNNANFMQLQTGANGTIHMQGTNPGISFGPVGSFASADYFIQRIANTTTLNVASAALISNTISGTSVYNMSAANGHLWNNTSGTFQMQMNASGQLLVGTNSQTASNLVAFNSTTRAIRLTNQTTTQMNLIANDAGMITYNTTAGVPYYNNGSAWLPFGGGIGAVTADNGLRASSATNVQLGGAGSQLLGNTTITTSAFSLTIPSSHAGNTLAVSNSVSGRAITASSTSGQAINANGGDLGVYSQGINYGVAAYSAAGIGVQAYSDSGLPLEVVRNTATTNAVVRTSYFLAQTTGTAANGFGGSIDFRISNSTGVDNLSNQLVSLWTDVVTATRTSQFILRGVNSAATNDILTLNGNGSMRANDYGIGSFTGTPAYGLAVDASGNIIEAPVGGGISGISANNGLSTSPATNVQLGGSALVQNTSILTSAFMLTVNSSNTTHTLAGINSSSGVGVYGESATQYGVYGLSGGATAIGVYGVSTGATGTGIVAESTLGGTGLYAKSQTGQAAIFLINPATTSTVDPIIRLQRSSTGTPVNGIGEYIGFEMNYAAGLQSESNRIYTKWTNVTTRTSSFEFHAKNANILARKMSIEGSGEIIFDGYGINTFSGTAAFVLGVSATGHLVEVAAAGSGMTNVLTTTGGMIYSSSGSTPAELLPGSDGEILTLVGGLPSWEPGGGGGGSVTTMSFTGGIISVANPTTAPALTVAGTSGGVVYFSSSSTWASSAVLASNSLMSGGGAGAPPTTITTASGIIAFIGSPTSANLAATITNETGSGALVFATSPTFVTPILGTPSSGTLTTGITIGDVTMNLTGTDATGDIYIRNASGVLTRLPIGTAGQVLVVNPTATSLQYSTLAGGGSVSSFSFTNGNGFIGVVSNPTTTPALTLGTNLIGTLIGNGTAMTAATSSTVGQVLRVTGANSFGYGALDLANANATTGALTADKGGTGLGAGYTAGQILWASNSTTLARGFLNGTANQINVVSNSSGVTISHAFNPNQQTLTSGAVITWNMLNGGNAVLTLNNTGATLANPTNVVAGYTYTLRIIQGSGGGRTITTWTNVRWSDGNLPDLANAVGAEDVIRLYAVTTASFIGTHIPNVQ